MAKALTALFLLPGALVMLTLAHPAVAGQVAHGTGNIELVGHANPWSHQYGDVGGDGDIVVVGSFLNNTDNGVAIFDVSDPENPILAADYNPLPGETRFQDVWVRDGIGYFGCWRVSGGGGDNGVHIVDLSDPYEPRKIAEINSQIGGHPQVHTLFLEGDYLYTASHRPNFDGRRVKVFNISDPANPQFVRNIQTTDPDRIHQITVQNGRLFTSGWGGHTDIFDVTNVANAAPRLGTIQSGSSSHSSWPTEDGNVLISCRETVGGDVRFFDISDPANPELLYTLTPQHAGIREAIPHNPIVVGDLLFLSWYQNGLQLFDISDPAAPVRIGHFDTFQAPIESNFQGNWGVNVNLGIDKVLLSDMSNGLFIVDVGTARFADNYPPLIVQMPEDTEVVEGSDLELSISVTGTEPLKYQWRRNGAAIPGSGGATLLIEDVEINDGGQYLARAGNEYGLVDSYEVTVSVIPAGDATPPHINSHPAGQVAFPGQTVSFSVTASGTQQLRYQWMVDGEEIDGAEDSSLTIGPVMNTDAGSYSVRVWNSAGEVESEPALLEVDDSGFFYEVRVGAGAHGAVVSWKTREPITGVVEYGPPHHFDHETNAQTEEAAAMNEIQPMHAEFDYAAPSSSRLATQHSAYLGGLDAETLYSFRMIGRDAEGGFYESYEFLFETAASDKGESGVAPEWWKNHYFGEEIDDGRDTDGDGWSVWEEYIAGTSPLDPASRPNLSVKADGGDLIIRYWPAHQGRVYRLESAGEPGGEWAPLDDAGDIGENGVITFTVPVSENAGFFRVGIDVADD